MKEKTLIPINDLNKKFYLNQISLDYRLKLIKLNQISQEMGYSNNNIANNMFIRLATKNGRNIDHDIILANEIYNKNKQEFQPLNLNADIFLQKTNAVNHQSSSITKLPEISSKIKDLPSITQKSSPSLHIKYSKSDTKEINKSILNLTNISDENNSKNPNEKILVNRPLKKSKNQSNNLQISSEIIHKILERISITPSVDDKLILNTTVSNDNEELDIEEILKNIKRKKAQDKPINVYKQNLDKSPAKEYEKIVYGDNRIELVKNYLISPVEVTNSKLRKLLTNSWSVRAGHRKGSRSKTIVQLSNLVELRKFEEFLPEEKFEKIKEDFLNKENTNINPINVPKLPIIKSNTKDEQVSEINIIKKKEATKKIVMSTRKIYSDKRFLANFETHRKHLNRLKDRINEVFNNVIF